MKLARFSTVCLVALLALAASVSGTENSRQLLQNPDCGPGAFFKSFDRTCMDCDVNCRVACQDDEGCNECQDGFYTSREDPEWPRRCLPCTLANCLKCRDDIFDAWPMQCDVCAPGFVHGPNRRSCVPDVISVGGVEARRTEVTVGSGDVTTVAAPSVGEETATRGCPVGSFLKTMDQTCMACDVNCLPGQCADGVGCRKCVAGFHTSSPDPEWPFTCVPCTVENCESCMDEVFDAWPKFCVACRSGFSLRGRTECVAEFTTTTFVGGQTVAKPAPPVAPPPTPPPPRVPAPAPAVETVTVVAPNPPPPARVVAPAPKVETVVTVAPAPVETTTSQGGGYSVPVEQTTGGAVQSANVVKVAVPGSGSSVAGTDVAQAAACPPGFFQKSFDGACMECDPNCQEGGCVDFIGCTGCRDGSRFRTTPDPEWPFTCELCTIPGCGQCMDAVFDAWPQMCDRCAVGTLSRDKFSCV